MFYPFQKGRLALALAALPALQFSYVIAADTAATNGELRRTLYTGLSAAF